MESERPIEKLLRAFSKRRRDQGGQFELHPATRNLLQGEVLRELGRKREGGAASFYRWWPQLAYGFGLFAVLGIVTYFIFLNPTGNSTGDLAQAPVGQAAPPPTSSLAAEPSVFFRDSQTNDITLAAATPKVASREEEVPASPAVPAIAANGKLSAGEASLLSRVPANVPAPTVVAADAKLSDRARSDLAFSAAPARAPVEAKAKAEAKNEADATANLAEKELADKAVKLTAAYRRTRVEENRGQSTPAAPEEVRQQTTATVLTAFRMERTGDTIKITDSDGSVYSGSVVANTDEVMRRSFALATNSTRETLLKSKALGVDALVQPVSFVVSGTNVSLKRNVVFAGRFTPAPPVQSFGVSLNSVSGAGGAGPAAKRALSAPAPGVLPPIAGKVKVEDGNPLEISIEATPTGP